jgi:hypothetical protein
MGAAALQAHTLLPSQNITAIELPANPHLKAGIYIFDALYVEKYTWETTSVNDLVNTIMKEKLAQFPYSKKPIRTALATTDDPTYFVLTISPDKNLRGQTCQAGDKISPTTDGQEIHNITDAKTAATIVPPYK